MGEEPTNEREFGKFYPVAKAVLSPIFKSLWRVKVLGREHLPSKGGAIFCPNHTSVIDSFMLPLVLPRRITFVGKAEYMDSWKTKHIFPAIGMIPIDRSGGNASERALNTAARVIQSGEFFGIYPEGTRARDGRLHRGHTGPARLALRTGAPMVVGRDRAAAGLALRVEGLLAAMLAVALGLVVGRDVGVGDLEGGALVACVDPELNAMLREFRWKELFWERRGRVREAMRFIVLGHAVLEQAMRPWPGITCKALFIDAAHDAAFEQGAEQIHGDQHHPVAAVLGDGHGFGQRLVSEHEGPRALFWRNKHQLFSEC